MQTVDGIKNATSTQLDVADTERLSGLFTGKFIFNFWFHKFLDKMQ
jgi:hypothetical protein